MNEEDEEMIKEAELELAKIFLSFIAIGKIIIYLIIGFIILSVAVAILGVIWRGLTKPSTSNYYEVAKKECANIEPLSAYEKCLERVYNKIYGYPENYSQEEEMKKKIAEIEKQLS